MDTNTLKATLAQLHSELASGAPLDPELQQLLKTLDQDIHSALARSELSKESADESQDDALTALNDSVQAIEARFSSEYPTLSTALRNVMDALGKMGI
ncbi:MAG: DUF4404 family protein [Burkholderiales bacterium]|nr:DUF4404 family protein [Burkholderiales bacterium]